MRTRRRPVGHQRGLAPSGFVSSGSALSGSVSSGSADPGAQARDDRTARASSRPSRTESGTPARTPASAVRAEGIPGGDEPAAAPARTFSDEPHPHLPADESLARLAPRAEPAGGAAAAGGTGDEAAPLHPAPADRPRWRAYLALTKPRIIELLLTTTIPTMILAAGGWPGLWLLVATVVGGFAAAGSANAFNMVIDRDIDALMNRTRQRPLVTGELTVRAALVFATVLGVGSVAWFTLLINPLSGMLAAAAIALYVVFYTLVLKRRTEQNIVWGGVAGCMPVLIGWAAVTNSLGWAPLVLFGVIFFWTPPHYWPLSMRFKKDYAAAGVPMLPVRHTDAYVGRRVLGYALATVACTLALIPVAGMGSLYTVTAVVAGAWFLASCVGLLRATGGQAKAGRTKAMKVFHGSITYLSIVFLAVALDPFLHLPLG